MRVPRPGEIYRWFDDAGANRPIVVLSREELNRGRYVLGIPFTTANLDVRRKQQNCVFVPKRSPWPEKDCVAQAEMLTTIEKDRLDFDRGPITQMSPDILRELIRAVGFALDADCEPT